MPDWKRTNDPQDSKGIAHQNHLGHDLLEAICMGVLRAISTTAYSKAATCFSPIVKFPQQLLLLLLQTPFPYPLRLMIGLHEQLVTSGPEVPTFSHLP